MVSDRFTYHRPEKGLFLSTFKRAKNIIRYLDFQNVGRIEPFGMLLVSSELQRCIASLPQARFFVLNHQRHTYAGHMGFFKAFGLDFGNPPGHAKGSSRYLPITLYDVDSLRKEAFSSFREIGDVIEDKSEKMAQLLTQTLAGNTVDTLTFCFREIIRNVIEHGQSDQFGYCAQYWPSRNWVQFAILDRGIGICQALSKNPYLQIRDDRETINLSLMPGKLTVKYSHNNWYRKQGQTSHICGLGGSFLMMSGNTALYLNQGSRQYFNVDFQGTMLCLCLKVSEIATLSQTLSQLRGQGREIARSYGKGSIVDASAASTMLRDQFRDIWPPTTIT